MFGPLTKSIPLPHPLSLLLFCTGLSDSEHWLQHRDLPPGVNPVLGPAAAEGPAPVAGPRVGPVNTPDDFAEPRGPNVPMLARPPIKVQQLLWNMFWWMRHPRVWWQFFLSETYFGAIWFFFMVTCLFTFNICFFYHLLVVAVFFLHRNDLLRVAEVQRVCTETATCLTQVPRVEETEDRARAQRRRLSGDLFIWDKEEQTECFCSDKDDVPSATDSCQVGFTDFSLLFQQLERSHDWGRAGHRGSTLCWW